MKKEELHRYLLAALKKKIPEKSKLVETLMGILFMEKGAVNRRLRGEVPFSFYEVVDIFKQLDISLNSILYDITVQIDRYELSFIDYADMNEKSYLLWKNHTKLISRAKNDAFSEIAESSNILPISLFAGFDYLTKYFLFKNQYQLSGSESRMSFNEMVVPERLKKLFLSYYKELKNFAHTIYIWDFLIFQYLVTEIRFFSGINLISQDDVRHIKVDLISFVDYVEQITIDGCFRETGKAVSFYISDINLDADYSYVKINDLGISLVRTFTLNAVTSIDPYSFVNISVYINSLKKTSTLISQSGAIYRTEFFEKQRMLIAEL